MMANTSGAVRPIDLVGLGEVLVELSADRSGAISRGTAWQTAWAGDVVNTLFYAARSGLRTGLVTRFGSDPFTPMITGGVASEGIDLSCSNIDPERPNGMYFIMRDQEGERSFHYRRDNSAARRMLDGSPEELDRIAEYLDSSRMILITGVTLAIVENRDRLYELLTDLRRRSGTTIAFDPNLRPALWRSRLEMRSTVERFLPLCDHFLPSTEDLELMREGDQTDEEFINALPTGNVLLKRGAAGAMLYDAGEVHEIADGGPVPVVDTTGAGDGLNGGYLAALLRSEDPVTALHCGLATARHIVGVVGAIDPTFCPPSQSGEVNARE